ncbi:MAG: hypothetical protein N2B02_05900, partial [Amylibacter sp.]
MRKYLLSAAAVMSVVAVSTTVLADEASAQKWINQEFQPSSLNKDEQMAEMKWFIDSPQLLLEGGGGVTIGLTVVCLFFVRGQCTVHRLVVVAFGDVAG